MKNCPKEEIRLKSHFLGPKSESREWVEKSIIHILKSWFNWRENRFPQDSASISRDDLNSPEFQKFRKIIENHLNKLTLNFEQEVPKYSPRYMGHMVSEISLPALLGHIVALMHNPNNSSFSSSKIGLSIEKEAIADLAEMIGFDEKADGHFTSGGTVANIEGLWRARFSLDNQLSLGAYLTSRGIKKMNLFEASHMGAREFKENLAKYKVPLEEIKPYSFVISGPYHIQKTYQTTFSQDFQGPVLLVPGHKHYSWQKALSLMGLGEEALWQISIDRSGHLDLNDLKQKIERAKKEQRPILSIVSVAGTTELGMIDPIEKIQNLIDDYRENENIHIWHHIDGAYGGIYASLLRNRKQNAELFLNKKAKKSLESLCRANSITIDPHKLALVPYACGAIIVKDQDSYQVSQFNAPYLLESEKNSGKWNSTLEGSRAATGATATWMIGKTLGFKHQGIGKLLSLGIKTKKELESRLCETHPMIRIIPNTDSNIVCFTLAYENEKVSLSNQRVENIYKLISEEDEFAVSKTSLTKESYGEFIQDWANEWRGDFDSPSITMIRMVMMNPFTISKENNINYLEEFCHYLKSKLL